MELPDPPEDAEYDIVPEGENLEGMEEDDESTQAMPVAAMGFAVAAYAVPAPLGPDIKQLVHGIVQGERKKLSDHFSALIMSQQNSSMRIDYLGCVREGNKYCTASFPGKYGEQWNSVTSESMHSSVACVFMKQGGIGYGRHVRPKQCTRNCFCNMLYGEPQPWGCYWFGPWFGNIRRAIALQQTLLVFFFEGEKDQGVPGPSDKPFATFEPGVGLGSSQKGEVAWLRMHGIKYESRDMKDWMEFVSTEMAEQL